jgi:hypothetical protein
VGEIALTTPFHASDAALRPRPADVISPQSARRGDLRAKCRRPQKAAPPPPGGFFDHAILHDCALAHATLLTGPAFAENVVAVSDFRPVTDVSLFFELFNGRLYGFGF